VKWEPPWIVEAKRILRERFDSGYACVELSDNEDKSDSELTVQTSSLNVFDSLPSLSTFKVTQPADELTRYLNDEIENINVSDGLKWWEGKQQTYPRLSQMAKDYLSIPGESCFVLRCNTNMLTLICIQLPRLMWSVCLAAAGLSSRTLAVVFQHSCRVQLFALAVGQPWIW
jgi:hypothetical protein